MLYFTCYFRLFKYMVIFSRYFTVCITYQPHLVHNTYTSIHQYIHTCIHTGRHKYLLTYIHTYTRTFTYLRTYLTSHCQKKWNVQTQWHQSTQYGVSWTLFLILAMSFFKIPLNAILLSFGSYKWMASKRLCTKRLYSAHFLFPNLVCQIFPLFNVNPGTPW